MIGFSVIAESWSTYASVPNPFLTLPATAENWGCFIFEACSPCTVWNVCFSLKVLVFFFFLLWGMKKSMPSRSCDQFPPASNSIHLLPRIDFIQLEVLSLLFQIWKICFLFGPFLCSSFKSLVTFPLFSPLGHLVLIVISQCACSFDSLPAKPRGKPFMYGRTS